jgi:hypothetical protein
MNTDLICAGTGAIAMQRYLIHIVHILPNKIDYTALI